MGNIVLLDDLTINKIAAGEVIERPASVIKEMIENSIDAGANNITVEIKNGGISFIKVIDNGKGILPDDMEIAFERHATSKIRSSEDLNNVKSMGFRGEALASIAAISNVEMISKTESQDVGYKVVVEAGNVLNKQEVGCQTGTSITVRNLFFNTPVRYKFLKKDYTESGYIEDAITRIALVNPDIAIKLINTGKTVIQTNGNGDIKSVIYSIYGKDVAQGILPVNYTYEDIEISGVIGKPEISRSNRSNQIFFVNKRYVKDKIMTSATEQAYKGLIQMGKFGFVVLNININPAKVDVNVHPAKLEVRFEEESKIFQSIYHAIKDTLLKENFISEDKSKSDNNTYQNQETIIVDTKKEIEIEPKVDKKIETEKKETIFEMATKARESSLPKINIDTNPIENVGEGGPVNTADVLEKLKELQNGSAITEEEQIEETENKEEKAEEIKPIEEVEDIKYNEEPMDFDEMYTKLFGTKPITSVINEIENEQKNELENESENESEVENVAEDVETLKTEEKSEQEEVSTKNEDNNEETIIEPEKEEIAEEPEIEKADLNENISVFEEVPEYNRPTYKFIGFAFGTYMIIEMNQEIFILNQNEVNKKIMYEKIKDSYYNNVTNNSQMLLLPDIITLTRKQMEVLTEDMNLLQRAGFILEEFGENTFKLVGVPTVCIDVDNKEVLLQILDELNAAMKYDRETREEKLIDLLAEKTSINKQQELTTDEAQSLISELLQFSNPFEFSNKKTIGIKMTKYDIERKFARK